MGDQPSAETLLMGRSVRALYEVRHWVLGACEGIELVMDDGPSVLLWNGTDWTLRINEGQWPELPTWAWPPEAWEFVQGEGIGGPGIDEILSVNLRFDSVGQHMGIDLGFRKARLVFDSGERMNWHCKTLAGEADEG